MLRQRPIIVLLGATATGKTRLSIELAKRFNGEIISADSMQVYKDLDITTAKATPDERASVRHHMLDVCDTKTRNFTIVGYRNKALPIVERLLSEDKVPIIVGGTNYYIESLLWNVLVGDGGGGGDDYHHMSAEEILGHFASNSNRSVSLSGQGRSIGLSEQFDLIGRVGPSDPNGLSGQLDPNGLFGQLDPNGFVGQTVSTSPSCSPHPSNPSHQHQLYDLLKQIDPLHAQKLHLNDDRRIRRALESYIRTGQTFSKLYAQQQSFAGSSHLGGPLRFNHVIGFWLRCEDRVLDERIDRRIDSMIAKGMLPEIRRCYNRLKVDGIDTERGIMQAIGFKEFLPYLQSYDDDNSCDTEITEFIRSRGGLSGQKRFIIKNHIYEALQVLEKCLDNLRAQTKRYSRDQMQWIRCRFLANNGRCVPPIYEINTTTADTNWHDQVYVNAEHIIQSYMDASKCNFQPMDRLMAKQEETYVCGVCQRSFVGEHAFQRHMQSRSHYKQLKIQKKQQKREAKQRQLETTRGLSEFRGFCSYFRTISKKIKSFFCRH